MRCMTDSVDAQPNTVTSLFLITPIQMITMQYDIESEDSAIALTSLTVRYRADFFSSLATDHDILLSRILARRTKDSTLKKNRMHRNDRNG